MIEAVFGIIILALLAYIAWQQREWREEREALIQRIQDPERAVVAYDRSRRTPPKPAQVVAVDDDDAMRKAIDERQGVSDGGGPE